MTRPKTSAFAVLDRLYRVIRQRQRNGNPETSYVARLLAQGRRRVAQKVGEEAVETVIAAVAGRRARVVSESADLLFVLSILWADLSVKPQAVFDELARREGLSGLTEKAKRTRSGRRSRRQR
ncbi:MAG: phosphoribosyl-ATP diphosphatase [Alphaproteobacteria bacterium]|nr:phosphoribosyl-ATP diphosphatase [Alphaproteobacteria bacterium]